MEVYLENLKNKSNSRLNVYKHLNLALEHLVDSLAKETIEELIETFNTDLLQGTNNGLNSLILNSVKYVLDHIKDNEDFKDSVMSISQSLFKHLMTIARFPQVQVNQQKCWDMISSLSDATLVNVIDSNDKQISSLISQSLNATNIENPLKELISGVLLRWLKMLSTEQLAGTVADCLNMWFGYHTSALILPDDNQRLIAVETMELILPYLKKVDYMNNPKWIFIMADLREKKRYTPFLLQLYQKKKIIWKRIWCIMLKLLESNLKANGLLINSLLPVLEQAFRDETTRKDAFYCWSVLIHVSISDQNETNNPKIVKLLCTPLNSNNAKTSELAVVKFKVWWSLIMKLRHEVHTYQEIMLYPFLNFCFGSDSVNQRIVPGLVFPSLQAYTVSCLVEMLGHEESCTGCVGNEIDHMKKPIVNNMLFDSANKKWLKVVKSAIVVVSEQINVAKEDSATIAKLKQQLKCIWISLLKIVKGIVNPNILALTFRNLVDVLASLCETFVSELVIDCFIPLMVKKDIGFSADFLTDTSYDIKESLTPLRLLILLLVSPKLYKYTWSQTELLPFKDIVCIELDKSITDFLAWIFLHLNGSEPSISIWCHLSDALTSSKYSHINEIHEVVLYWPLDNDIDLREIPKVIKFWRELYDFVGQKVITPKKKNRTFLEDELNSKITKALESESESKTVLAIHASCTMIKYRSKNHPASQVTNQPHLLKLLLQLLCIVKNFDAKDHVIGAVLEAADCVSSVLGTYNSRKATPEYLVILKKSAEATLKTVDHCLQKTLFTSNCSEYSTKLAKMFPACLSPAFSAVCCPIVSEIILTLSKKNEENMVVFKDVLQMVYKLQNGKKISMNDFKSPQQKSSVGDGKESKVSKTQANPDSQDFVVIKPNWKFDPKKLTEHQKEVLTRRRENIPALYEDLSQSQDDYNMKTWKPAGYANDETSDSSKESRDKSIGLPKENGVKDDSENKLVNGTPKETNESFKNVLRIIPVKDNESNKEVKVSGENDSMKLSIVASPKVNNKKTSFQARLERSIKKLQEESVKLDDFPVANNPEKIKAVTSPLVKIVSSNKSNATTPIAKNVSSSLSNATTPITKNGSNMASVTTPIVKNVSNNMSSVTTPIVKNVSNNMSSVTTPIVKNSFDNNLSKGTTPIIKVVSINTSNGTTPISDKPEEISTNGDITPIVQSKIGSCEILNTEKDVPVTPISKATDECTLNIEVTPVQNQNEVKPCESERPIRHKKTPNKLDVYDVRFHGKRRASTSVVDLMRANQYSSDSNDSESVTSNSQENDDTTPTKIKRRKMRLLKNLQIDTVDGHPNKDIFDIMNSPKDSSVDENHKPAPMRRRNSVLPVNRDPKGKNLKGIKKSRKSEISDQIISESSEKLTESAIIDSDLVQCNGEIATVNETLSDSDVVVVDNGKTVENCTTQDEPIVISDEPVKSLADESVTVVEPVLDTPMEVTEHSEQPEINLPNIASTEPKSDPLTVIELSDEEGSDEETISSPNNMPESQDVIQSSQDSLTNVSVTPKRISMIINGKAKSSPSCNNASTKVISEPVLTIVVIPDTQVEDLPDTADLDTLPVTNASVSERDLAEKSTEAMPMSSTMELVSPEHMEAETQINDIQDPLADEIEEITDTEGKVTDNIEEEENITDKINIDKDPHFDNPIEETETFIEENEPDAENDEMNELADRSTILSSPFEHDMEDRNAELLNNTLDISPIKTIEQDTDNIEDKLLMEKNELESLGCKVLSDNDSSSDTDMASSPADSRTLSPVKPSEISPTSSPPKLKTNEKISPSLREPESQDVSPPKEEISSPSSCRNKKISRPLISRLGGRAAQMLGMCKRGTDSTDQKFSNVTGLSPVRMIARKNLHTFCGSTASNETPDSKHENENLLEFSKTLPSPYASPTGPILKKPHDDQISSPSSGKKKRVSFHDPPVSMLLSIEKYIDPPSVVGSPQRSKPIKSYNNEQPSFMKQSKVAFCLVKKIESVEQSIITGDVDEANQDEANLSELCSLETNTQEPIDVINNHLLDDEHPIFPTLYECQIPITEIASELTSDTCKEMFLNEIRDEIQTIGDLASLTELKVNRLPISFPKVNTVKKVLSEFESTIKSVEAAMELEKTESEKMDVVECDSEMMTKIDNSMDSVQVAERTTQSVNLSTDESDIDIIQTDKSQPEATTDDENVKIEMHGKKLDYNNDEDMIKLLDKLLEKKAVSDYLSQNIQKYFTLNLQLLPPETKFS